MFAAPSLVNNKKADFSAAYLAGFATPLSHLIAESELFGPLPLFWHIFRRKNFYKSKARVAELVDATDLKSVDRKIVPVRVRLWAPMQHWLQLFSVHNATGSDTNITLGAGPAVGSTLDISLGRVGGVYSLGFNGTDFIIDQPTFLNGFTDLNVGIFAANALNDTPKVATFDSFFVNVDTSVSVPEPGTLALLGIGLFGMGLARRKA